MAPASHRLSPAATAAIVTPPGDRPPIDVEFGFGNCCPPGTACSGVCVQGELGPVSGSICAGSCRSTGFDPSLPPPPPEFQTCPPGTFFRFRTGRCEPITPFIPPGNGNGPPPLPPPPQVQNGKICCPSGTHPNKSDYFRRGPNGQPVFIPKGTICVTNRRRNPLNPRAADRAISRIRSAKKAVTALNAITIRKTKC